MVGWAFSVAMFYLWLQADAGDFRLLLASGLFAIAGSIGYGLDKIARK